MKMLTAKSTLMATAAALTSLATLSVATHAHAAPIWKSGEALGRINNPRGLEVAQLNSRAEEVARGILGTEAGGLRAARSLTDDKGLTHIRMKQTLRGQDVFGADLVLHMRGNGNVYLVNGRVGNAKATPSQPALGDLTATDAAVRSLGIETYDIIEQPELAYAIGFDGETIHLTWRSLIQYTSGDKMARDYIYVDAINGEIAAVDPTIHYAKAWRTYDAQRAAYNSSSLPGVLNCDGAQSCSLTDAQNAHNGASDTYDYYFEKFGRDSLNDAGFTLISSVNVCDFNNSGCSSWNNAAWIGTQMIYGDGDGVRFASSLANGLDVVAHELTHGVTDFTSDLVYANASGALNEALSDIFGANVEADVDGGISADTWKLGEDIFTPGTAGDALRYMDNPTLDGYSTDYFPTRIPEVRRPTASNDNGGVHGNSGIFNLAYYLLVEGGTHPRGVTTDVVTGIGIADAEQIFYRANNVYFTSGTDYSAALAGATQAATDLFGAGSAQVQSVIKAFCAVGVGTQCDAGGTGGGGGGGGKGGGRPPR